MLRLLSEIWLKDKDKNVSIVPTEIVATSTSSQFSKLKNAIRKLQELHMNYVVPTKTIPVKDQRSYSVFRKFCNFCKACNFSYIVIASSTYFGFRITFQIRWIIESIYTLSLLYSLSTQWRLISPWPRP